MSLKKAYLYLVSVISLVIAVIGAIMLLNLALKTWIFPKADRDYYGYDRCSSVKPMDINGEGVVPPGCSPEEKAMLEKERSENRSSQKQRDAAQALAMLLVATPIWLYHWKMARKEQ